MWNKTSPHQNVLSHKNGEGFTVGHKEEKNQAVEKSALSIRGGKNSGKSPIAKTGTGGLKGGEGATRKDQRKKGPTWTPRKSSMGCQLGNAQALPSYHVPR